LEQASESVSTGGQRHHPREPDAGRIAFVAPRYHTNQHLAVRALLDRGHSIRFFALLRGQSETYEALSPRVLGLGTVGQVVDRLFNRDQTQSFRAKWGLPPVVQFLKDLSRFRPTVLVVRDPNSAFSFLALIAGRAIGARLVIYTQGPRYRPARDRNHVARYVLMRAFRASWMTPVEGDKKAGILTEGVHHVPFVADVSVKPKGDGWLTGSSLRILAVGKYIPRKNHLLLLEAVARLSDIPIRLTIVGECSNESHQAYFSEVLRRRDDLGLHDRVYVEANYTFAEVQREYQAHDLFVLASSMEPAAISVLEAMANGIPVISSDSNGTRHSIHPGLNGYLFRSGDLEDLVARIRDIWNRRDEIAAFGALARSVAERDHSPERYYEAFMAATRLHKDVL
jgi:glycosyltransferase involved in cell wall biosynthesis